MSLPAVLAGFGGFVLGLAAVAGLAVVDWAAWVLVLPNRRPGTLDAQVRDALDPNDPARALGTPIEATAADGVKLAGLWHTAGPSPAHGRVVLLIHGFAEDPSALRDRTGALTRHGWDVAALDLRAHGRSGGDRSSFGGREAGDVSAWVDALAASGRLGDGPAPVVALWGRSMGAAVAVRAASADRRVAALVLEAPYADLERTLAVVLRRKRVPMARFLAARIVRRAGALAGASLTTPRPVDLAPGVTVPVLVIHGAADSLVDPAEARTLAGAFAAPAGFVEVPGAGHNAVAEAGGPGLLERVAAFLDEAARLSAGSRG